MKKDYVVITVKEYEALLRRSLELDLLEKAGVDNWRWYGEHRQALRKGYPDFMEIDEIVDLVTENRITAALEIEAKWFYTEKE